LPRTSVKRSRKSVGAIAERSNSDQSFEQYITVDDRPPGVEKTTSKKQYAGKKFGKKKVN
jgi:hypothetical protein